MNNNKNIVRAPLSGMRTIPGVTVERLQPESGLTRRDGMKLLGGALAGLATASAAGPAFAQARGPLRIDITRGNVDPLPIAVTDLFSDTDSGRGIGQNITRVVVDLGSGDAKARHDPRIRAAAAPLSGSGGRSLPVASPGDRTAPDDAGRTAARSRSRPPFQHYGKTP